MSGWIKLYRAIQDHWVFQDAEYFRAWCIILMRVNHEPKKALIHGKIYECDRGQSLLSLNSWVEEFGVSNWSIRKVRTFFKLLENDHMITTEGMQKTTRLTVCNYESYQDVRQANDKQTTSKRQTDDKQTTTTKELKNDKKNTPANAGGDFIEQVYGVFKKQYHQHRGTQYVEATRGKDRSAIGKIVAAIKGRNANKDKDTQQMLHAMDKFFDHAIAFDDSFLQENMTPPTILMKINTLLSGVKKKSYNPHEHVM